MSSSSASTLQVDNTTKSNLFLQDDEDLLAQLSSGDIPTPNALDGLLNRWLQDQPPSADAQWVGWVGTVRQGGFAVEEESEAVPPVSGINSASVPAAFETSSGKNHVGAVGALLRIPNHQAIQLTLSALVRFDSSDRLQSLLGTQELVQTVLQYHARQRIARLRAITELLRLEQDESYASSLQPVLDNFDKSYYRLQQRPRTFFKILLSSAAADASAVSSPSRAQVLPLRRIRGGVRPDTFVQDCWDAFQDRDAEREEGLEATLVLLYSRTQATRLDLALILASFQSCSYYVYPGSGSGHRLSRLAGMICAACMSLCLASGASTDWVRDHPLLVGITEDATDAKQELDTIRNVLLRDSQAVATRRRSQLAYLKNMAESDVVVDAPEALGLLGLGLLMRLSQLNQLQAIAIECVEFASDHCGVFGYARSTLKQLLLAPTKSLPRYQEKPPYDWLLDAEAPVLALEAPSSVDELHASQIAYASIGLELVSSTIAAFPKAILGTAENVALMASLAAVVYANQPVLCEQFWRDFESYSNEVPAQVSNPTACELLNAAYNFAKSAEGASEEACLPKIAPLLVLISGMCSSKDMVSNVVESMPPSLFQIVLELCAAKTHVTNEKEYVKVVRSVVESMHSLTMIGDSGILRKAIGENGPNLLYGILSFHSDNGVLSSTIKLLAGLADDPLWLLQTVKLFGVAGMKRMTTSSSCIPSSAELLTVLTKNTDTIVFRANAAEGQEYMETVLVSVLGGCEVLSTAVAAPRFEFSVAHNILQALTTYMDSVRRIVVTHPVKTVRTSAAMTRDALVQSLATSTSLGQALAHFCCAPVSMSLAIGLEVDLYEANVQKLASEEYAVDDVANKYGAWRRVVEAPSKTSDKAARPSNPFSRVKAKFAERLLKYDGLSLDLDGIRRRGWVKNNQEHAVVHASASALSVLKVWALCVQDIIRERDLHPRGTNLQPEGVAYIQTLSPFRIVTSLAVAPPVVREQSGLLLVWPTEDVSVLDLLIKIVDLEGLPVFGAISVIRMTLDHAGYAGGQVPAIHRAVGEDGLLNRMVDDLLSPETKKVRFRLSAIHLLSSLSRSDQLVPEMLSKKERDVVSALFDSVAKVVQSVKLLGDSYLGKLCHDEALIEDLRVATGALAFMEVSERGHCGKERDLLHPSISSDSFLSGLIMLVSALPEMQPVLALSPTVSQCKRTLRIFLSSALNILSFNLAKAEGEKRVAMVSKLKQEGKLSQIKEAAFFLDLDITSLDRVFSELQEKAMSTLAEVDPWSLVDLFPAEATRGQRQSMLDVATAASWLFNLNGHQNETGGLLAAVDVCASMLASQLQLCCSWAQFLQVGHHFGAVGPKEGMKSTALIQAVIGDIVEAYDEGNDLIQKALYSDLMKSFSEMLGLLLQSVFADKADDSSTAGSQLLETLDHVVTVGVMITKMSRVDALQPLSTKHVNENCSTQVKVLSCTTFLLNKLDGSHFGFSAQDKEAIERCLLEVVSIVGDGLRDVGPLLENESLRGGAQRYMEVACTVLMASVARLKGDPKALAKVAVSMEKANVVGSLVQHGIAASKIGSLPKSGYGESISLLKGTVTLLTVLGRSSVHCSELLSVLSRGRLSQLVVHNPLIQAETSSWSELDGMRYRGYLKCATKRDNNAKVGGATGESSSQLMNGRDDPMHQLWIDVIDFHATMLQSMEALPDEPDGLKDLVFDFVETYRVSLLQSLNHCDATAYSIGMVWTNNVLQEVSSVLSLVSALYSPCYRDTFESTRTKLSQQFKERSKTVISSLSKFLGASGSARELFRLVAAIDQLMNRDDEDFRLSPTADLDIHAAFSSGVPSARHQAIANAHLATRCYGLVFEKEYKASSHATSSAANQDQVSQISLEQTCQLILSSEFNRSMEHSAALCLTNAIRLLWRTRPTSTCFTMLSEEEAHVVDSITLVQPGMIVALRPEAADIGQDDGVEPVRFARVLKMDTVRREWKVKFLRSFGDDDSDDETIVSMDQLAGMEDPALKNPILRFAPAPDSAKELEEYRNQTSVGDLITALRWCHQFDADGSKADLTVRECLAQAAALLLGEELALHKEIKADDRDQSGDTSNRLHKQLLHLFDERSMNAEDVFTRKVSKARTEAIKKLLGPTMWAAVQQQLKGRLVDAKLEQAKRAEERRASQQKGMARRTSSF